MLAGALMSRRSCAPRGLFITGTDTGVGKTFVAALLLAELRRRGVRAAAFKPIACGAGGRADARLFAELMDGEATLEEINPIYLRKPLAPYVAARLEKRKIDFRRIYSAFRSLVSRYDFVFVEGAGGWLVPITGKFFVRELALELKLPVLVVARLRLGTLNHTLLTLESVRGVGLSVAGIVLSDATGARRGWAERTNPAALRRLTGLPVAEVPHRAGRAVGRQLFLRLVQGRIVR